MLLFVVSCLFSTNAFAYDAEIDGIYYNFNGDEAEVTYKNTSYNSYTGDIVIPSSIKYVDKTYRVTNIGDSAFKNCKGLTSINIPASVNIIGNSAFYNCFGLKSIVIGRNVTSIGSFAFYMCSNLRTIINLSSVAITGGSTSNGYVAYYAYKVVSNPNSIEGNFVFSIIDGVNTLMAYIGNDTEIVLPDNYRGEGYVIGAKAFYSDLTITSIVIPDNVTSIGDWAFFNCKLLESVNIPNSITDIGDWAFRQCSKLKNITLSNTLCSLGNRIFYDCIALERMEIPNSVISIGEEAFFNCASLKDVTIGSNVMSIGEYAFHSCETLAKVKMPSSITKIEQYAFNGCEALTFIIIPPNVTSLGRRIFEGCRNLKTIINLSSIQFIISSSDNNSHMPSYSDIIKIDAPNGSIEGDNVFGVIEGTYTLCKYLGNDSNIILPNNYKGGNYRIGANAFSDNEVVSNVMIPNGVMGIGDSAFKGCKNLSSITCLKRIPPTCGINIFFNTNITNITLHVPYGSKVAYEAASPWNEFGKIVEIPIPITVGETGFATFCSTYALDFSEVEDIRAYIVSGFNQETGTLVLTRVTEVPAGEGLYIAGMPGNHEIPQTKTSMFYANLLKGVTEPTIISPTDGNYTNYILSNGSYGVGFYTLSQTGTLDAGKAYLQLPTASVAGIKALKIEFDENDDPTGIAITSTSPTEENTIYNLAGQRMNKAQKGVNIVNGKKVFIK